MCGGDCPCKRLGKASKNLLGAPSLWRLLWRGKTKEGSSAADLRSLHLGHLPVFRSIVHSHFHVAHVLRSVWQISLGGMLESVWHLMRSGPLGLSVIRALRKGLIGSRPVRGQGGASSGAHLREIQLFLFQRRHDSVHRRSGTWVLWALDLMLVHRVQEPSRVQNRRPFISLAPRHGLSGRQRLCHSRIQGDVFHRGRRPSSWTLIAQRTTTSW